MRNFSKKLKNIVVMTSLCLLLSGCLTIGPPAVTIYNGERISLSPCVEMWGEIDSEELQAPLYEKSGCDILTRRTLEDIVNNNEMYDFNN